MRVEILYVPGCLNHGPALRELNWILNEEGVPSPVIEIEVSDRASAESLAFAGSPTIRIDGADVVESASGTGVALACRTYLVAGRFTGVPPEDSIRRAVRDASSRRAEP